MVRTELETRDPAKAWAFLEAVYGAELRVTSDLGPVRCLHQDLGRVFVEELEYGVGLDAVNDAFPMVAVVEVVEGWTEFEVGGARHRVGAGEVLPVTGPGHPFRAVTSPTCRQRVVGLPVESLARATRDRGGSRPSIRPGVVAPLTGAAAAPWRALTDYLTQTERAHPRTFASPLAASAVAGLVAHTALSLFADDTWAEPGPGELGRDSRDGSEPAVRRAIAYIESAADQDIVLVGHRRGGARHPAGDPVRLPPAARHHADGLPAPGPAPARARRADRLPRRHDGGPGRRAGGASCTSAGSPATTARSSASTRRRRWTPGPEC